MCIRDSLHTAVDNKSDLVELKSLYVALSDTSRVLNTYITDIKRGMKALGEGDLTVKPNVEFVGDFTELRDSIMAIVASFRSIPVSYTHLKHTSSPSFCIAIVS